MVLSPQAGPLVFPETLPPATLELYNLGVVAWNGRRLKEVIQEGMAPNFTYRWVTVSRPGVHGVSSANVTYNGTTKTISLDVASEARLRMFEVIYFEAPDIPDADADAAMGISADGEVRRNLVYQGGGNVMGRDLDNASLYKVTRGFGNQYFVDDNEPLDRRLGVVLIRSAKVTLNAAALQGLATQRIAVLPAPPAGEYYVVPRITMLKTGGPASPVADNFVSLWLAATDATGGLLTSLDAADNPPDYLWWDHLAAPASLLGVDGVLRPGDYAGPPLVPFAGSGGIVQARTGAADYNSGLWTGQPLTLLGFAAPQTTPTVLTPAQRWAQSTAALDASFSLTIVVDYERRRF